MFPQLLKFFNVKTALLNSDEQMEKEGLKLESGSAYVNILQAKIYLSEESL